MNGLPPFNTCMSFRRGELCFSLYWAPTQ